MVVGVLQVAGGLYLARPLGPPRLVRSIFWSGIAGSLTGCRLTFKRRRRGGVGELDDRGIVERVAARKTA